MPASPSHVTAGLAETHDEIQDVYRSRRAVAVVDDLLPSPQEQVGLDLHERGQAWRSGQELRELPTHIDETGNPAPCQNRQHGGSYLLPFLPPGFSASTTQLL
jgi:hypothetical protein